MDPSQLVDTLATQGVAVAVLAFLLVRLEKRMERIDRLLTIVCMHFDIPTEELANGDTNKIVRMR